MIGTAVQEQLVGEPMTYEGTQGAKHQPVLLRVLAEELGVKVEDISDFELCLADYNPAVSIDSSICWQSAVCIISLIVCCTAVIVF